MTGHFSRAERLYAAVAAGDLGDVRVEAEGLTHEESGDGMGAGAKPYIEQLHAFAGLAARAPDLPAAASAVARVGATCGSCHVAMHKGPRYQVVGGPPAGTTPVAARMIRHRWAADRLWEGLIGPSDTAWKAGAGALYDAPLYTDALTRDVEQYGPVTQLAWTVHDVGARALMEADHKARAELYGQLLGTCARCHGLLKISP
jgi:cytochrome c553